MDIFELFSQGKVYLVGDLEGKSLAIPLDQRSVTFNQQTDMMRSSKTLDISCETGHGEKVTVISGEVPEEIMKTIRAWQRVTNSGKRKP